MNFEYKIPTTFFSKSEYAKELSDELENDAEGLIFDQFIHDIGAQLHIDIIYKRLSPEQYRWLLGKNQDVEVFLDSHHEKYYQLSIIPLTPLGEQQALQLETNTGLLH
ncbi:hypothetical protein [Bacillus pinisoli]|uniref:hypothetical protein n=1 Tax=Bacillus pinisoli TaxID=2901866 RepID=UPI001FF1E19F|nr:hypothetical protein [Bacillus pinisoli]